MSALTVVIKKELRDGLRDRRALITLFMMPVVFLGMATFLSFYFVTVEEGSRQFELPVVGAENAQPLMQFLRENGIRTVDFDGDPAAAVKAGKVDFVLIVPDTFAEEFNRVERATLELVSDPSKQGSARRASRVRGMISQWGAQLGSLRLLVRGIAPEVGSPVAIDEISVASSQQIAARLVSIVPLMFLMTVFTASVGLSVDMMAGERERHSLEPLLLNPVKRQHLVWGKWMASFICTLFVFLITALGVYWILPWLPLEKMGLAYTLRAQDLLLTALAIVPLALLATVAQLFISIFAKSFKEAQTYLSLLIMLPMGLGYYALFSDNRAGWQDWVPVLNAQLVMEETLSSEGVEPLRWLVVIGSSLLMALLMSWAVVKQIQREKIIYG